MFSQFQPTANYEPPACIQNAMMTKDKKPFTYTPGGLDLSQIKTPSMARRMARQRSLEDQEQAYQQPQQMNNSGYRPQGGPQGGPPPPPPPPMKIPAPPPPPPIVIQVPDSKSPKPVALGERPEIVIPENPIGMLRKTNSPYHWEVEKDQQQRIGPVPKFQEKVPSPLTVKMPPSTFSQQQPQTYTPQNHNNFQRHPESPIHRPEAQYSHQHSASPQINGSPPTRELLVRQDSQFNKSPQPFSGQSPVSNSSPFSPSPNNNWRQPEKRDSPIITSPPTPQNNRGPFSPNTQQYSPSTQQYSPNTQPYSPNTQQYSPNYQNQSQNQSPITNSGPVFHTLPRVQRTPEVPQNNNVIHNNVNQRQQTPPDVAPWRTQTLNRYPKEPESKSINNNVNVPYTPQWKSNEPTNNENVYIPPWQVKQENNNQQHQPARMSQDVNNNKVQENQGPAWRSQNNKAPSPPRYQPQEQPRYQSTMSIPVTPRKQTQPQTTTSDRNNAPQKEAVYVNQEPVYFCPESPKSIPPWVKTQKEKTKTPPPEWVQKPLEGSKTLPRDLVTPTRETEPEWVKKSNELQKGAREVVSPPKYQQPQPTWSTRPSDNRKSLPRDGSSPPSRVIPIQMEVSSTETRNNRQEGPPQPQLRITIGMNPASDTRVPFSPPTQRIMRVLSPQLVRVDEPQHDLPTLNRTFQGQDNQPKTRIIPIQVEGGNSGANKR